MVGIALSVFQQEVKLLFRSDAIGFRIEDGSIVGVGFATGLGG